MNYNILCTCGRDPDLPSADYITASEVFALKADTSILMLLTNTAVTSSSSTRPAKKVLQGQDKICLNGTWKFQSESVSNAQTNSKGVILPYQSADPNRETPGETAGYTKADFNDAGWDEVQVPGSWNTLDRYANHFGNG